MSTWSLSFTPLGDLDITSILQDSGQQETKAGYLKKKKARFKPNGRQLEKRREGNEVDRRLARHPKKGTQSKEVAGTPMGVRFIEKVEKDNY
ncbi:hypothetical protein K2173_004803 [Erythroxylum novogranatense]|uniref:Uncharacterized protein n=1 Tax=Erythroxylum novogranatense TaxID=1862640 RepID=A0AAV8SJX0_9ROSI|nr:hypothetical protein K2173_004803 [Erythroxylum novogranatense]